MTEHVDVVVMSNMPAPYRIPLFNYMSRQCNGRFEVCFVAPTWAGQEKWEFDSREMMFRWTLLTTSRLKFFHSPVKVMAGMYRFLQRRRPRAFISGGYDTFSAWVAFAWCKITGNRFVVWIANTDADLRPKSRIRHWIKQFIVRRSDGVVVSGKGSLRYAKSLGAGDSQIFVAPTAMDNERFASEARRYDGARERQSNGWPSHMILYSGRLVRHKGVFVLLEAFREVSRHFADCGLILVGHGPAEAELKNYCRTHQLDRVYFAGAQPYFRLPYYYALSDILVLPTFSDPWGLVVNEAYACGVPVIVSDIAGACEEMMADGVTGFAVKPGDAAGLADRILRLLTDERLHNEMRQNCRKAVEPFSIKACGDGLLAAAFGRAPNASLALQESRA